MGCRTTILEGNASLRVELMFGPNSNSMNKALCGCGALADLDANVLRRKQNLGKRVECSRCRNRRIAEEKEALDRHFQGLGDEDPDEERHRLNVPNWLFCHLIKLR